jgi:hypothetical protein
VAAGAGSVGCDALLLALVRASGCRLTGEHLPTGEANTHILRAVEGARKTLPLRSAVRVLGLSLSQYHAWKRADRACDLADQPSCPKRFPGQLTAREVTTIDEAMSTRHLLDVQVTGRRKPSRVHRLNRRRRAATRPNKPTPLGATTPARSARSGDRPLSSARASGQGGDDAGPARDRYRSIVHGIVSCSLCLATRSAKVIRAAAGSGDSTKLTYQVSTGHGAGQLVDSASAGLHLAENAGVELAPICQWMGFPRTTAGADERGSHRGGRRPAQAVGGGRIKGRQLERPRLVKHDRAVMVALTAMTRAWRETVLLVKPESVLRWHLPRLPALLSLAVPGSPPPRAAPGSGMERVSWWQTCCIRPLQGGAWGFFASAGRLPY